MTGLVVQSATIVKELHGKRLGPFHLAQSGAHGRVLTSHAGEVFTLSWLHSRPQLVIQNEQM